LDSRDRQSTETWAGHLREVGVVATCSASARGREAWNFILHDHEIGRTYALHLIDHVDVHGERLVIVPKVAGGRKELATLAARA
jgi:hypothetical protein